MKFRNDRPWIYFFLFQDKCILWDCETLLALQIVINQPARLFTFVFGEKGCAFPPPIIFLFLDKATWRGEDLLPETDGCFLLMPHKRLRVQKKGIFNSAELTICVHFTVSCFPDMFTLQMLQLMAMTYFEW